MPKAFLRVPESFHPLAGHPPPRASQGDLQAAPSPLPDAGNFLVIVRAEAVEPAVRALLQIFLRLGILSRLMFGVGSIFLMSTPVIFSNARA